MIGCTKDFVSNCIDDTGKMSFIIANHYLIKSLDEWSRVFVKECFNVLLAKCKAFGAVLMSTILYSYENWLTKNVRIM